MCILTCFSNQRHTTVLVAVYTESLYNDVTNPWTRCHPDFKVQRNVDFERISSITAITGTYRLIRLPANLFLVLGLQYS